MCIYSILDNDMYKFSMSYSYMKLFPNASGTFEFIDRGKRVYSENFRSAFEKNIKQLSKIEPFDSIVFNWLKENCSRYIPIHYWEWLRGFKYDPEKIIISYTEKGELSISVTDYLYKATLYEVPILAIVSETWNEVNGLDLNKELVADRLKEKVKLSNENELYFSDFGTRRRFSYDCQRLVVKYLVENAKYFIGTSNLLLAFEYKTKPIGTMAHEWIMFHAAHFGYRHANYMAMENWVNVFDGDLGIVLTDTLTSKVFFDNFSRKHAKLFDGVRHDSGDPILFTEMTIRRYEELGIDPSTKTIIFSNALTMPTYKEIVDKVGDRIKVRAGIGTNLTNDTGHKTSNIVMKLVRTKMTDKQSWIECVKISDDLGKHTGNPKEYELACFTLDLLKEEK